MKKVFIGMSIVISIITIVFFVSFFISRETLVDENTINAPNTEEQSLKNIILSEDSYREDRLYLEEHVEVDYYTWDSTIDVSDYFGSVTVPNLNILFVDYPGLDDTLNKLIYGLYVYSDSVGYDLYAFELDYDAHLERFFTCDFNFYVTGNGTTLGVFLKDDTIYIKEL